MLSPLLPMISRLTSRASVSSGGVKSNFGKNQLKSYISIKKSRLRLLLVALSIKLNLCSSIRFCS